MASSYVNNLRLEEIATGEQSGTWGDTTNTNLKIIGQAVAWGTRAIANASTDNITIADGALDADRCLGLKLTGGGQACTVTLLPNTSSKTWFMYNATAAALTFTCGSGANVIIPAGQTKVIATDGLGSGGVVHDLLTAVNLAGVTTVDDLIVSDDLVVADDASVGGTLGVTGIATFTDDIIIGDGKTIGSASDVDAMSISSGGVVNFSARPTFAASLTIQDGGSLGSASDLNAMTISSGGVVAVTATTASSSSTTGALTVGGGLGVAADLFVGDDLTVTGDLDVDGAIEFDSLSGTGSVAITDILDEDNLASDSATKLATQQSIKAYVDANTGGTLTEVLSNGNRTTAAEKIEFRDAAIFINSSADGQLDIVADTEIQIAATTIDINGAINASGEIIAASLDISGAIDVDGVSNLDVIDVDGAANFAADVTFATGADIITASAGGSNFRAGVNAGNSIASGGNYNVVVGDEAGTAITTGDYNTAVGYNALATESAGAGSTAFGAGALQRQLLGNGTDSNNVGIGYVAGTKVTTGKNNVIIGRAAYNVTTASNNIAIGTEAMATESTGQRSVAIGTSALATQNVTDASLTYNVAVGFNAGITTTTGSLNTFVGGLSGDATTTGFYNSCLGIASLGALTTGAHNVGVGDDSNPTVTTGNRNLCIGRYAGYGVTTGSDNIVMGYLAGYAGGGSNQMTGGSNHLIGNYTNVAAAANTTCIVIGHSVAGKGSNTAFIGGSGGAYQQNNSADWSTTSDRRLKKNIVDSTIGLAEINQLQVRNFEYRTEDEITELDGKIDKVDVQGVQIGVIAQEIQAVLPKCVTETSQGVLTVNADNLTWHLIKAVQELSAANTALAARITALEGA